MHNGLLWNYITVLHNIPLAQSFFAARESFQKTFTLEIKNLFVKMVDHLKQRTDQLRYGIEIARLNFHS